MKQCWISGLLLAALCGGCKDEAPPATVPAADPGEPTEAQPRLQTLKLYLGSQEVTAELALTVQQIRTGMMFRTNMPENTAMLFVLPVPQTAGFWMKNCPLPLSVAYIDSDGVIREVHDMEPHNTNSIVSAFSEVHFALETPQGWFKRHGIGAGVVVTTARGPLKETFFGKQ